MKEIAAHLIYCLQEVGPSRLLSAGPILGPTADFRVIDNRLDKGITIREVVNKVTPKASVDVLGVEYRPPLGKAPNSISEVRVLM
jgi:hypothetical protein